MWNSLLALVLAAVIAYLLTPLVRRLAMQLDAIDKPDRHRKRHRRLVPLWGGMVIFFAALAGLLAVFHFLPAGRLLWSFRQNVFGIRMIVLLVSALLLLAMGLWDDARPLPPKVKLLVQLTAALLIPLNGFYFEIFYSPLNPNPYTLWPLWGSLLAIGWLVFIMNAFNFIDGLDGLACGQAVFGGSILMLGSLALAGRSQDLFTQHQCQLAALLAAVTAGAALGFWRFNWAPARIFLGDAGATLLGFGLGMSALLLVGRSPSPGTLVFALSALAWPIFDTIQVMVRRWRRGEPISKADNRHLHHYLLERGFTPSGAVALIHTAVLLVGMIGLLATWL